MPRRRCIGRNGAAPGRALDHARVLRGGDSAFAQIAVGKVPRNQDRVGVRVAGGRCVHRAEWKRHCGRHCPRCLIRHWSVNVPVETSRQSAESESNSHPGLRSHMALIVGLPPITVRVALPYASALAASRLKRNAPFAGNSRVCACCLIGTATGRQMRKVVGELVVDRSRRSVVQRVLKNGAGDAGVLVIERNEGVPGYERYIERNRPIGEANFGEWEFAAEVAFLKTWKPFGATATQALSLQSLVEDFEGRKWALN